MTENRYMVFTAVTKEAQTYGQDTLISKDRFEMFSGVKFFFYDKEIIEEEFEIAEVIENYPFYLIKCTKKEKKSP
ncbi:hypothetical protein K8352_14905 [Flavobacteriaceae bacterium F89]|uniref:Uncharacterized protein n=1 Tax=Cerina litoralis TaxID=2874477 RepID=A0AAE3JU51_9FLAO|nr:hypothetical protein [Cerina litoralis]MCG2462047.1 hypothetical protein [Cerina litoralis]